MLLQLDPHSGVPMYRQMMDQIKFHLATGLLTPGDELPSIRNLSAELGINPMTISKSYAYLEKEGLVERRPGKPLVVKARSREEQVLNKTQELRKNLKGSVRATKQLGISKTQALAIFEEMLTEEKVP